MIHLLPILLRARRRVPIRFPYVPPEPNPNLLLWSEQFQQPTWDKTNASALADQANDPGGEATADLISAISEIDLYLLAQTAPDAPAGSTTYTFSVYLQAAPGSGGKELRVGISDDLGSLGSSSAPLAEGLWSRRTFSAATSPGANSITVEVLSLDGTIRFYAAWAKLEEGSSATAYVKREGV